MPSKIAYKYRSIKKGHIRVLILEPGSGRDPLACSLDHVPLDEDANFDAISYCWGSSRKTHRLFCEGKRMGITQSLREALWQFRHPVHHRRLWADAVCINQKNVKEKNHQVEQMHEVYELAEHVLIWAGRAVESDAMVFSGIETVFHTLKDLHSKIDHDLNVLSTLTLRSQHNDHAYLLRDFDKSQAMFSAFQTLGERQIFSRGWIVQEVTLAERPILCCGNHSMDFDHFTHTFVIICQSLQLARLWPIMPRSDVYSMTWQRIYSRIISLKSGGHSLLEAILFLPDTFKCSIPQDYVFACRGLLEQHLRDMIPVDYDMVVQDLYKAVIINAVQMQEINGLWECLLYGQRNSAEQLHGRSMPSWVPDIQGESKDVDVVTPNTYDCCGRDDRFEDQLVVLEDENTLVATGFLISSVDGITLAFDPPAFRTSRCQCCPRRAAHHAPTHFRTLLGLVDHALGSEYCDASQTVIRMNLCHEAAQMIRNLKRMADYLMLEFPGTDILDSVETWRAVCRDVKDMTSQRMTPDDYFVPKIWLRLLQAAPDLCEPEQWSMEHGFLAQLTEAEAEELIAEFHILQPHLSISTINMRDFGKTASGQLCWLPKETQHEDMICIFAMGGSMTPFVLRPAKDGAFSIIGAAYVHGIMDGEAIPDSLEGLQEIRLV